MKFRMQLLKEKKTWVHHGEIEIDTKNIPAIKGMTLYEIKKYLSTKTHNILESEAQNSPINHSFTLTLA